MNNREFSLELEQRTRLFSTSVIKYSSKLPYSPEIRVIRHQITKSVTSIGANYREANRARSKADFASKISICEGEASESIYWLELLQDIQANDHELLNPLKKEANELLSIFTTISKSLRRKN